MLYNETPTTKEHPMRFAYYIALKVAILTMAAYLVNVLINRKAAKQ